jgi:hypothetical protein
MVFIRTSVRSAGFLLQSCLVLSRLMVFNLMMLAAPAPSRARQSIPANLCARIQAGAQTQSNADGKTRVRAHASARPALAELYI